MITKAQLDALANTLSLTSNPSTSQAGVIQISVTPDLTTTSLEQTGPGQTVTALLKFVRFADAALALWTANITGTQLTSNVATYTFSGATGTPQVGQTVTVIGCSNAVYNITGTIASAPDSTHFTISITNPDIPAAGSQNGIATVNGAIDILSYLASNVLGGQPMPAIRIPLPGPGLQGAQLPASTITTNAPITGPGGLIANITSPTVAANPPLPSLGNDSGLTMGQRIQDLLAGVPGIVAHVEQQATAAIMAPVTVSVTWTLIQNETQTPLGSGSILNFLPLPAFVRLGTTLEPSSFTIQATVTISAGGVSSDPVVLPTKTISVPQIAVPQMAALFTWQFYGTQVPTDDDNNADDDSTLLMIPSDSPVLDVTSITIAFNQLVSTLQALAATFNGGLTGLVLDPAIGGVAGAASVAGNLASAVTGIGFLNTALHYNVTGHSDFKPVVIAPAAVSGTSLGGISDVSSFVFDTEDIGLSHDRYHDHAKSALIIGPPGCGLELDHDKSFNSSNGQVTMMTENLATAGGALFVGVRNLNDVANTLDPAGANVQTMGASVYRQTLSMKFLP